MKPGVWLLGACIILTGCTAENRELSEAMEYRDRLLSAQSCSFRAEVTADYGDSLNQFSMDCQVDSSGGLDFVIAAPQSIAGIQGSISAEGGKLRFDGDALYFPLLTDEQLIPASAPWILLKSLRSGCITSVCREEEALHVTVDDSFEDDALTVDVWLKREGVPIRGDILCDGKRILSLKIESFAIS